MTASNHLEQHVLVHFMLYLLSSHLISCPLFSSDPMPPHAACSIDILMSSMSPDPSCLRSFLIEQPDRTLFTSLVRGAISE